MTHIWVPKFKIIEPKSELKAQSRMAGFFKMTAIRPDGRERPLTGWFPNLITNRGLNLIGEGSGYLNRCFVGSGSATPLVTDTQLATFVASNNTSPNALNSSGAQNAPPYYGWAIRGYQFDEGVAAGTLSEIGISTTSGQNALFSRALILDEFGDPTTITVLSDEILQVQYELRNYPPLDDELDTITIGSTAYDTTTRAASVTSSVSWTPNSAPTGGLPGQANRYSVYAGDIGPITGLPSGASSSPNSAGSTGSYGNNNFYRDGQAIWGISAGNFNPGIRSVRFNLGQIGNNNIGNMQTEFDPVIPKTSSDVLTLNFRHRWGRYEGDS